MHPAPLPQPSGRTLEQLLDPQHPLCKDDVIWLLDYIKKKVAEEDPDLLDLSQPRLLKNFRYFAEISMLMLHRRPFYDQDADRLRQWMAEAVYGLHGKK
ncbi:hypothetical protein [Gorillibacterium sp. sgz5001074]|uniref:hypothetical protein n=1 Tax=Gorillibacterium sp. sgz5001074 TaxID=3446695 RepID=UPI003F676FC8